MKIKNRQQPIFLIKTTTFKFVNNWFAVKFVDWNIVTLGNFFKFLNKIIIMLSLLIKADI